MVIFCLVLIIFGIFNIRSYLIKEKHYKVCANIGLYVASIGCLIFDLSLAILMPFNTYCRMGWFLTAYSAAYCNLIVGAC